MSYPHPQRKFGAGTTAGTTPSKFPPTKTPPAGQTKRLKRTSKECVIVKKPKKIVVPVVDIEQRPEPRRHAYQWGKDLLGFRPRPTDEESMSVSLPSSKRQSGSQSSRKATKSGQKSNFSESPLSTDPNEEFVVAVLERESKERYGCFGWNPKCLQLFAREPDALLAILCILTSAVTYLHYGVIPAASSQLQRRFHLTHTDMAIIRLMFEIGALVMLIPVIMFDGKRMNRPQWIAIGGALVGFGGVTVLLPHLIAVGMTHNEQPDYCAVNTGPSEQSCVEPYPTYKYLFMAGEMLIGMGMVPSYVIGLSYLDENITHRKSALCTAALQTCQLLGPILSFIVTSIAMKREIGTRDVSYGEYGSWWIALLIGILMSWIGAVLILPYPKQLTGSAVARIRDAKEAMAIGRNDHRAAIVEYTVMGKIKALFCNPVFVGSLVDNAIRVFMVAGFVSFAGKYLETLFDLTPAESSLLIGSAAIVTALVGLGFGTLFMYLGNLRVTGTIRLCLATAFGAVIIVNVFRIHCASDTRIAGVTMPYPNSSSKIVNLTNECNSKCDCDNEKFRPVCFVSKSVAFKNATYYSSCFAGCRHGIERITESSSDICDCMPRNGTVTFGSCKQCSRHLLKAFLLGGAWFGISVYMRHNLLQQLILRGVKFHMRTVAIALSTAVVRITASPAAYIFAWIMDKSCTYHAQSCGYSNCVIYDRTNMSDHLHMALLGLCMLSFLALFIAAGFHEIMMGPKQQSEEKTECDTEKAPKHYPDGRTSGKGTL